MPRDARHDDPRQRLARALGPFGAETLDALDRVSALRLCEPASSLDALDTPSITALRAHVDELEALVGAAPQTPRGEDLALQLCVTRSMRECAARWLDAWSETASRRHPGQRFVTGLRALHAHALAALRARAGGDEARRDLAARVARALRISPRPPLAWQRHYADELLAYWPAESTAYAHVTWCAAFGAAPASPFEPILSLWELGAWPVLLATGGVLAYVPHRVGDGLVVDPARPDEEAWPLVDVPRALVRATLECGFAVAPGRLVLR